MKILLLALLLCPACCFALPTVSVTRNGHVVNDSDIVSAYRDTPLANLQLVISVGSTEGDPVALNGTVSDVTTQGILDTEFSATSAATPYVIAPSSGTFNVGSVYHTVTLVASDGINPDVSFTFQIRVASSGPLGPECKLGKSEPYSAGCAAAPGGGLPALAVLAVIAWRRRKL